MKGYLEGLRISNEEINKLTREAIQESLIYLLGKKDMEKITVTEIVEKAGVSRSAYYRNYNSKEDILDDFSENFFQLVWSSLQNEDYKNDAISWFYFIFNQFKSNERLIKLIIKAKQNNLLSFEKKINLDNLSPQERYKVIALENGISAIINSWAESGFDVDEYELAIISAGIFNDISLLFKK